MSAAAISWIVWRLLPGSTTLPPSSPVPTPTATPVTISPEPQIPRRSEMPVVATTGVTFVLEPAPVASSVGTPVAGSPAIVPASPPGDRSIVRLIPTPPGFTRVTCPPGSFGDWLRHRKLKRDRTIRDFRGDAVSNSCYHVLGVIDCPLLFRSDLEQCADFCMRFWADYHKSASRLAQLHLFNYDGRPVPFRGRPDEYRGFLRRAFSDTNSWSLKLGCRPVAPSDLRPGDMFVQNRSGGIGHVSMVIDACRNDRGERLFLIGFSFMPAQEFHVERADARNGRGGWFTVRGYRAYLEECLPFDSFGEPVLRRF